jgi:hypothetical protein
LNGWHGRARHSPHFDWERHYRLKLALETLPFQVSPSVFLLGTSHTYDTSFMD